METDLNTAIENHDRDALSTIRTAGLENALKLQGIDEYSDASETFQVLSDRANEALLPLCGE